MKSTREVSWLWEGVGSQNPRPRPPMTGGPVQLYLDLLLIQTIELFTKVNMLKILWIVPKNIELLNCSIFNSSIVRKQTCLAVGRSRSLLRRRRRSTTLRQIRDAERLLRWPQARTSMTCTVSHGVRGGARLLGPQTEIESSSWKSKQPTSSHFLWKGYQVPYRNAHVFLVVWI